MDPAAPKDNVNPTIVNVKGERSSARKEPLMWSQMGSFQLSNDTQASPSGNAERNDGIAFGETDGGDVHRWLPTTAEDRSILCALSDIASATNGRGVSLLKNAGLVIPKRTDGILQKPLFSSSKHIQSSSTDAGNDETTASQTASRELLGREEIFDIIRNIQDPEHPHTLEQLGVVNLDHVQVLGGMDDSDMEVDLNDGNTASKMLSPTNEPSRVEVRFTPTIPHCSMATLIGLCLRVKLLRSLPSHFKINVQIQAGTHASENAINKQLRDKERVCAALENKHLAGVVNKCIKGGMEAQ